MKINLKLILLVVLCTIILYSIMIFLTDIPKIQQQIYDFKINYLPPILILIVFGWFLALFRWHILVKNLGIDVPLRSNFTIFFSSMALAMIPGRVGDLVKSQMLKNRHGISRTKTAPLVFLERYYDLIGAVIASSLGILFFQPAVYVMTAISIFLIICFIIASSKTFFEKCIKKFNKVKFLSKFTEPLLDSYDVIHKSTRGKVSIIAILLSTSRMLVYSTAVYFILLAYDITNISILEVIPIYLSSIVLGAISLLPGGLGIAEGSLAGFLNLFIDDISIILSISIIIRIFTLWIGIIIGFVFLRFVRDVLFENRDRK